MTHERIPYEGWEKQTGHVQRYEWVKQFLQPTDHVADLGCGIGYGAQVLDVGKDRYTGYDKAPPAEEFVHLGKWRHPVNLDTDLHVNVCIYPDVAIMFEVLEHLVWPQHVARTMADWTRSQIFVSVPIIKTTHRNPHHLHDFTVDDIPPLFPGWRVADEWAQPSEYSHVWRFVRE